MVFKKDDLFGNKYNRWTIIERVENGNSGQRRYLCECECGVRKIVQGNNVYTGKSKSCGCLNIEAASQRAAARNTTHGNSRRNNKSLTYSSWASMMNRCNNKNAKGFIDYGGRGISVCDRWREFENFLSDMGPRPSRELSIDRVDVNGNYSPDNCRWATSLEQTHNRRSRAIVAVSRGIK